MNNSRPSSSREPGSSAPQSGSWDRHTLWTRSPTLGVGRCRFPVPILAASGISGQFAPECRRCVGHGQATFVRGRHAAHSGPGVDADRRRGESLSLTSCVIVSCGASAAGGLQVSHTDFSSCALVDLIGGSLAWTEAPRRSTVDRGPERPGPVVTRPARFWSRRAVLAFPVLATAAGLSGCAEDPAKVIASDPDLGILVKDPMYPVESGWRPQEDRGAPAEERLETGQRVGLVARVGRVPVPTVR